MTTALRDKKTIKADIKPGIPKALKQILTETGMQLLIQKLTKSETLNIGNQEDERHADSFIDDRPKHKYHCSSPDEDERGKSKDRRGSYKYQHSQSDRHYNKLWKSPLTTHLTMISFLPPKNITTEQKQKKTWHSVDIQLPMLIIGPKMITELIPDTKYTRLV